MKWTADAPTMPKQQRLDYLCSVFVATIRQSKESNDGGKTWWRRARSDCYDALSRDFVDAYLEETNVPFKLVIIGACPCPMLGKDLKTLADEGILRRWRSGVEAPTAGGWPKWVWCYTLNASHFPQARTRAARYKKAV